MTYQLTFPSGLDDYDWDDIESKGWLKGVVIAWGNQERELSIFDETRLLQAIRVDLERLGYAAIRNLIVVPRVARDEIEATISRLAERRFTDL